MSSSVTGGSDEQKFPRCYVRCSQASRPGRSVLGLAYPNRKVFTRLTTDRSRGPLSHGRRPSLVPWPLVPQAALDITPRSSSARETWSAVQSVLHSAIFKQQLTAAATLQSASVTSLFSHTRPLIHTVQLLTDSVCFPSLSLLDHSWRISGAALIKSGNRGGPWHGSPPLVGFQHLAPTATLSLLTGRAAQHSWAVPMQCDAHTPRHPAPGLAAVFVASAPPM